VSKQYTTLYDYDVLLSLLPSSLAFAAATMSVLGLLLDGLETAASHTFPTGRCLVWHENSKETASAHPAGVEKIGTAKCRWDPRTLLKCILWRRSTTFSQPINYTNPPGN